MLERKARDVGLLDATWPIVPVNLREQPGQAGIRAGAKQGTRSEQEGEACDQPQDRADIDHGVVLPRPSGGQPAGRSDEVGAVGECGGDLVAGPADEPHGVESGERKGDERADDEGDGEDGDHLKGLREEGLVVDVINVAGRPV